MDARGMESGRLDADGVFENGQRWTRYLIRFAPLSRRSKGVGRFSSGIEGLGEDGRTMIARLHPSISVSPVDRARTITQSAGFHAKGLVRSEKSTSHTLTTVSRLATLAAGQAAALLHLPRFRFCDCSPIGTRWDGWRQICHTCCNITSVGVKNV